MSITQDEWTEITEEYYEQMLEVLPPIDMSYNKFIGSEPYFHNEQDEPIYFVGRNTSGKYEGRLMTVKDYRNSI